MSANLTPAQHEDLVFLRETMRWTYWPWCPVKRGDTVASCFDGEGGKRTVYLKNLLLGLDEGFKGVEKIEYENSYKMLLDGWIVD